MAAPPALQCFAVAMSGNGNIDPLLFGGSQQQHQPHQPQQQQQQHEQQQHLQHRQHHQQGPSAHSAHSQPPHSLHGAGSQAGQSPYFQHTAPTHPTADVDSHLHLKRNGQADDDDDSDGTAQGDGSGLHNTGHPIPGLGGPHGQPEIKRPRACDYCRQLKVRCDRYEAHETCKRCAKASRQCVTSPPTRKRTRKNDDRYTVLQQQIQMLMRERELDKERYMQHHTNMAGPTPQEYGHYPAPPSGYTPAQSSTPLVKRRRTSADEDDTTAEVMVAIHRQMAEKPGLATTRTQSNRDPFLQRVDMLVSPEQAQHLFRRYTEELFPAFPAVPLPANADASTVRDVCPLLYLAVIVVAPYGTGETIVSTETQRQLAQLLKETLAEIVFTRSERSLEIIQVMQLAVLWYRVPEHYDRHSFSVWVDMACCYASNLRLGRNSKRNDGCTTDPNTLDARRTLLVNYYLSISITMILRQPLAIRWGREIQECLDVLTTSPQALKSDKVLCKHVQLAQIWEKVYNVFDMTDPDAEVDVLDPLFQTTLKQFEDDLDSLSNSISECKNSECRSIVHMHCPYYAFLIHSGLLLLSMNVTNIFIHEAAMQEMLPDEKLHSNPSAASAVSTMLNKCLMGIHGTLDAFIGLSVDDLMKLPVLFSKDTPMSRQLHC